MSSLRESMGRKNEERKSSGSESEGVMIGERIMRGGMTWTDGHIYGYALTSNRDDSKCTTKER